MLKFPEMSIAQMEEWIHRGKIAAAVYAALIILTGFIYIVAVLAGGAFGAAFLGLLGIVGGCSLAALAWGGLHLARIATGSASEIGRLHERVDVIESSMELHDAQSDLSAALVDDLSALVAGKLEEARFPRIAQPKAEESDNGSLKLAASPACDIEEAPEGDHAADSDDDHTLDEASRFEAALAAGDLVTCRSIMPVLVAEVDDAKAGAYRALLRRLAKDKSEELRAEFTTLLRAGDFAAALELGVKIETQLPGSRMATDFRTMRPRLKRRITSPERTKAIS